MEKIETLSVFFPFWNEEGNVEPVVEKAIAVVKKIAKKWEILIIDDGSTDKTFARAKKLENKYPQVRVITHKPNRGYGAALKEGFSHAKYEFIVFTDGDGQFNFAEVDKFLALRKKFDVVIGFRKKRNDTFLRFILMKMLKVWDFLFFGIHFKDIDCGFKMFRKTAVDAISPLRSEGAMITTEILTKAKRKGLKIGEVEVNHYPRSHGEQSGGNVFVIVRAVLESFILYLDIRSRRF